MFTRNAFWKRLTAILAAGALGTLLLAGCASQQAATGTAVEGTAASDAAEEAAETAAAEETADAAAAEVSTDAAEGAGADTTEVSEDQTIPAGELQAAFDNAVPYEGEIQVVLHTSSGEEVVQETAGSDQGMTNAKVLAKSKPKWLRITGAAASSTLYEKGYDYSVWNMLDWDPSTCWVEGNPYSEGTMEGFIYYMDRSSRIDGFRIYPGYQKSKKTYRNNILPAAIQFEAGGYEIWCDLDRWLRNINKDGEWYYVDIYFNSPIYADSMYVMIGAVKTYGKDPYHDCCISEFHPFYY